MSEEKESSKSDVKDRIVKLLDESELQSVCSNLSDWEKAIEGISGYNNADKLSDFLKLISNPIRLKIILILLERDWACNCEFEYAFNLHQALISHHLKLLKDGNIVTLTKKANWNYYSLLPEIKPVLTSLRDLLLSSAL